MRKIIFAINSTINGFADHTVMLANEELHDFFIELLNDVDAVLYGRKTYQLMESYWPNAWNDSRSTESEKRFADTINPMQKIVFSNSLTEVNWENSSLAAESLIKTVIKLKSENGKNVAVGSLTLASQLLKQNLIDEFWFAIHPVVALKGPPLFEGIDVIKKLNLVDSITFSSGVVVHHYLNT